MTISIKNLNKTTENQHRFTDLFLDFEIVQKSKNAISTDILAGNDLLIATDTDAIKNSVKNILTQKRYFVPQFNVDLHSFIGTSLSEMNAHVLGERIERALALFEPRIRVRRIIVSPDYDNFAYLIAVIYNFRNFNTDKLLDVNLSYQVGTGQLEINK